MTKLSLIGEPLSRNDILKLSGIFEDIFQAYCKGGFRPSEANYRIELSTIMGLGFTTALIDRSLLHKYERYLSNFLRFSEFKEHKEQIKDLSQTIAKVISRTVYLFRFIELPQYYNGFVEAVKRAVNHHVLPDEPSEETKRLLKILFREC